jgi:hypothetical protein
MQCIYYRWDLDSQGWEDLRADLDAKDRSKLLGGLLDAFREAGAVLCVEESAYTDRDFSAAHAAFYSKLHQVRPKHCRRLHFFSLPLAGLWEAADWSDVAKTLQEEGRGTYLGYIVVRPLAHAPVSHALLSSRLGAPPGADIAVRSTYQVHVLGAQLEVEGAPITEQDSLTGSCAQATIWAAGRHLHAQHDMPWFSVVDITEAAVKPTDSALAAALPVGSESLSADNIVRALRAMGEHPVVYDRWDVPAARTIAQYLDSGIPVIVGLNRGDKLGHAVVAVGTVLGGSPRFAPSEPAPSDCLTHIVVNDDQRGPYELLRIEPSEPLESQLDDDGYEGDQSPDGPPDAAQEDEDGEDGYSLADVMFLIVPLPDKVYLKAEVAEAIARDKMKQIFQSRRQMVKLALKRKGSDWHVDPDFDATNPDLLLARTYLTTGWKYKYRMMRNSTSPALREEVNSMHLPRYVWVTEFCLAQDVADPDPCKRRVRGHILIDATGNRFDDGAVLLAHVPGLLMGERSDADGTGEGGATRLRAIPEDQTYYPKVRGWYDFSVCDARTASSDDEGRRPTTE